MRRRVVGERLDHLPADLQLVLRLRGQRDGGAVAGDGDDLGGGEGGGADAHEGLLARLHRTPAKHVGTMTLGAKLSGIPDNTTSLGRMAEPITRPVKVPAAHQALTVLAHLGRQAGPVPAAARGA